MPDAAETPNAQESILPRGGVMASNDQTSAEGSIGDSAAVSASATDQLPDAISVGALLRETREKAGMSAADISTKLRMGLKQVVALENSDYAALPTGTFLRGFVRNYAKAVGLNADEVLTLLEKTHRDAAPVSASQVVVPSQQNIKVPSPGGELATPNGRALVIGTVILLLLAAVWYWWEYIFSRRNEVRTLNTPVVQAVVQPQPAPAPPSVDTAAPAAGNAGDSSQNASPQVGASTPGASATPGDSGQANVPAVAAPPTQPTPPTVAPQAGTVSPPVTVSPTSASRSPDLPPVLTITKEVEPRSAKKEEPRAGSAVLGFTFTGESWVEVVDSRGKSILSRKFNAGDAEEITGRAPFSVIIGDARATRMAFNGREYDLAPHTRGAVARLMVK